MQVEPTTFCMGSNCDRREHQRTSSAARAAPRAGNNPICCHFSFSQEAPRPHQPSLSVPLPLWTPHAVPATARAASTADASRAAQARRVDSSTSASIVSSSSAWARARRRCSMRGRHRDAHRNPQNPSTRFVPARASAATTAQGLSGARARREGQASHRPRRGSLAICAQSWPTRTCPGPTFSWAPRSGGC